MRNNLKEKNLEVCLGLLRLRRQLVIQVETQSASGYIDLEFWGEMTGGNTAVEVTGHGTG